MSVNAAYWEDLADVHAVTGGGQWRGPSMFDCLLSGALLRDLCVTQHYGRHVRSTSFMGGRAVRVEADVEQLDWRQVN